MNIEKFSRTDLRVLDKYTKLTDKIVELERVKGKLHEWISKDCRRDRIDLEQCVDFYIKNNE